jgi:hypothetical protein
MRVWGRCPQWGFGGEAPDLAFASGRVQIGEIRCGGLHRIFCVRGLAAGEAQDRGEQAQGVGAAAVGKRALVDFAGEEVGLVGDAVEGELQGGAGDAELLIVRQAVPAWGSYGAHGRGLSLDPPFWPMAPLLTASPRIGERG